MAAATRHDKPALEQHQLSGWSLLERFLGMLDQVAPAVRPGSREAHPLAERRQVCTLALFISFFNTHRGFKEVPAILLKNARVLRATRWQMLRLIYLPASLA